MFGSKKKDPRQKRYEKLASKFKGYLIDESVRPLMNIDFMRRLLTGSEIERELANQQLADRIWERKIMGDAGDLADAWLDWQGIDSVDHARVESESQTLALHFGVYKNSENRGAVEVATPLIQEAFVQACMRRLEEHSS